MQNELFLNQTKTYYLLKVERFEAIQLLKLYFKSLKLKL